MNFKKIIFLFLLVSNFNFLLYSLKIKFHNQTDSEICFSCKIRNEKIKISEGKFEAISEWYSLGPWQDAILNQETTLNGEAAIKYIYIFINRFNIVKEIGPILATSKLIVTIKNSNNNRSKIKLGSRLELFVDYLKTDPEEWKKIGINYHW